MFRYLPTAFPGAHESTGNLHAAAAQDVLVMVTHDPNAAAFATKARHLEKGEKVAEGAVPA